MRRKRTDSRKRTGDKAYTKSTSTFLSWPLDDRRIRMGLVASYSGNGETRVSHVWVVGIVKHHNPRQGVMVFIYDDSGTAAHEEMRRRNSSMALHHLLTAQKTLFDQLKSQGFVIKAFFYGGRSYTGGIEQCLENASVFCERFVNKMAAAEGFTLQMIIDEGLEQMSLHFRKVKQEATVKGGSDGGSGHSPGLASGSANGEDVAEAEDEDGDWEDDNGEE
jgi:hypothetical protein